MHLVSYYSKRKHCRETSLCKCLLHIPIISTQPALNQPAKDTNKTVLLCHMDKVPGKEARKLGASLEKHFLTELGGT